MRLKTKLSVIFAFVVLIMIVLIGSLTNVFIKSEFKKYVIKKHENRTQEIAASIGQLHSTETNEWDVDSVHTIGMSALYEGYIVKVYDNKGHTLWDAEKCDMEGCMMVMGRITELMAEKYPNMYREIATKNFPLLNGDIVIGGASISYIGPFFLSDNEFYFLEALNIVLLIIGLVALALTVVIGLYLAKRLSKPICSAAHAARLMAEGNYEARVIVKDSSKELEDLADSINYLADSLSCQENLRKQLTADVAHELRTPITSVQTHLEAMIEGLWEVSPDRLTSCHEEVKRIGVLMADLEGLAKVDSGYGALNKSSVNLRRIIDRAVSSFEIYVETKQLTVTIDGTVPNFLADETRVHQVITNLLSNSVKYTAQGGCIKISLLQEGGFAAIIVEDNGSGIPESDLPFIFERFYRADKSRNRKTGGYGVGLAVVKSIVAAHGGRVEVQSGAGRGSCFKVLLPMSNSAYAIPAAT